GDRRSPDEINLSILVLRVIGDQEAIVAAVYSQFANSSRDGRPIVIPKSKINTVDYLAAGYPDCSEVATGEQRCRRARCQLILRFNINIKHWASSWLKPRAEGRSSLAAPFPWVAELAQG